MSASRRGYYRLALNLPVVLQSDDGGVPEATTTHNLSATGALVTTQEERPVESWVRVELMLPRGALGLRAQVMRIRPVLRHWVIGLRFQHNHPQSEDAIVRYLFDCERKRIRVRQQEADAPEA